jgi:hypothetical protein
VTSSDIEADPCPPPHCSQNPSVLARPRALARLSTLPLSQGNCTCSKKDRGAASSQPQPPPSLHSSDVHDASKVPWIIRHMLIFTVPYQPRQLAGTMHLASRNAPIA